MGADSSERDDGIVRHLAEFDGCAQKNDAWIATARPS